MLGIALDAITYLFLVYVRKLLCQFQKTSRVQGHITLSDVAFLFWDHRRVTRGRSLVSQPENP